MDKYAFVKQIGKGAFGEAALVQSKSNGQRFICKEIHLEQMPDDEKEAARKEVAILSQFSHPNIVRYHDSFEVNTSLYIIMEFADGGDISKRIAEMKSAKSNFPEEQILNWFVQISMALKHLHDRHVLHRDLKTENIFLTRDNVVKLGDFGISTVLQSTVAVANTVCGTPYYFSPEICQNKPYGVKSDIWALGVVLYELCTLEHAFDGSDIVQLVQRIIAADYPPITQDYSKDLKDIVAKLLQREPEARPSIKAVLSTAFIKRHLKGLMQKLTQQQASLESGQSSAQGRPTSPKASSKAFGNREATPTTTTTTTTTTPAEPQRSAETEVTEVKDMRKMDKAAMADFLKGPPPEEVTRVQAMDEETRASGSSSNKNNKVAWAGLQLEVAVEDIDDVIDLAATRGDVSNMIGLLSQTMKTDASATTRSMALGDDEETEETSSPTTATAASPTAQGTGTAAAAKDATSPKEKKKDGDGKGKKEESPAPQKSTKICLVM
eukprot:NODE_590_length_2070_cov_27.005938_g544_i0.p1 GENE.NODE_590_length_2070_cov_27.005938_g544_i0~~NODE_590_length_2070_cov_27.005938_g544_i0.p1  ORF type:complete len:495 (+),score=125.22 NODE_590_length_2070_cov_27.005938_g544_i0:335-1819(+)